MISEKYLPLKPYRLDIHYDLLTDTDKIPNFSKEVLKMKNKVIRIRVDEAMLEKLNSKTDCVSSFIRSLIEASYTE